MNTLKYPGDHVTRVTGCCSLTQPMAAATTATPVAYDVAIVGQGPAGLAAQEVLVEYGLTTVTFGPRQDVGMEEDWTGLADTPFMTQLQKQGKNQSHPGTRYNPEDKVVTIRPIDDGDGFRVEDAVRPWNARCVLVASGTTPRSLFGDNPQFEHCVFTKIQDLTAALDHRKFGKGASTLVIVTAPTVAVLLLVERFVQNYGDRSGLEKIIISTTTNFESSLVWDRVRAIDRVEFHEQTVLTSIITDEEKQADVRAVTLKAETGDSEEVRVDCDYVLTLLGTFPNTSCLKELDVALGDKKQVLTDDRYCTSVSGVFAAGSVRQSPCDLIEAMHQGRCAAKQAISYVEALRRRTG